MCDATLIASTMAQVAGASMQNNAMQDANRSKALMMRENQERNRQLEDTQRASIQEATAASDASTARPGMEEAAVDLSNILKAAITGGGGAPGNAVSRSAPQIVQDAQTSATNAALVQARNRANAIANLDATSQYLGTTIAPKIAESAAVGGMTGNFMRGNSAVTDTGMQYASSKAYSPMAQILSGAGQTGMAYGQYDGKKVIPADKVVKVT